jgi:hypothetical protein
MMIDGMERRATVVQVSHCHDFPEYDASHSV